MNKVTRFEYIDETGRVVVRYLKPNERIELSYQDDGQTLKVFLVKNTEDGDDILTTYDHIKMMQEEYSKCLDIRDWYSCDYYADQIASLRKSIGIIGAFHPLEEVKIEKVYD